METAEKRQENENTSYPIYAMHYNGIPAYPQVKQLPEITPSKSLLPEIKVGTFSHHFGETPKYALKDGRVYFRTANALHSVTIDDFAKYGTFFGEDDFGMKEWLAVGEDVKPADFDIVPVDNYRNLSRNRNEGAMEGVPLRMHFPNKKDTPVNLYVRTSHLNAPINRDGYWASKIENFEQDLRDFLFDYREMKRGDYNPEAEAWFEHRTKKGYKNSDKLINIGAGLLDDNAVAATFHGNPEGYVALVANKNFKEYVKKMMEKYGLYDENSLRLGKDAVIMHETLHFSPKGQPGRGRLGFFKTKGRVEHAAGKTQADFYRKRKGKVDSDDAKAYTALEKDHEHYAEYWSLRNRVAKYFSVFSKLNSERSIDGIIEQFRNEARLLGFTEGEEDSYVESRLNDYETAKQAENDAQKIASKGEPKSGLEAMLKSERKSGSKTKADKTKRNEYNSKEYTIRTYLSEKQEEVSEEDGNQNKDSQNADSEGEKNESRCHDKESKTDESDSKDSERGNSDSGE